MADNIDPAEELLKDALNVVTGSRRGTYGNPEDSFATIADFWNTYLRRRKLLVADMTATDVTHLMILFKMGRLAENPHHKDSRLDIPGYAACGQRCSEAECAS